MFKNINPLILIKEVKNFDEAKIRIYVYTFLYFIIFQLIYLKEFESLIYLKIISYLNISFVYSNYFTIVLISLIITIIIPLHYEKSPLKMIYDLRKSIDLKYIFFQYTRDLNREKIFKKIKLLDEPNFRELRNNIFFKYTTTTQETIIDNHLKINALSKYTVFWIALNYFIFSIILLVIMINFDFPVLLLSLITCLSIIYSMYSFNEARKVTEQEVKIILKDEEASLQIKETLDNL